MMTIQFINDFHSSKCSIRKNKKGIVSDRKRHRIWEKLCGIYNCYCTDKTGIRGGRYSLADVDGNTWVIIDQGTY